jgi:hypothetical protein
VSRSIRATATTPTVPPMPRPSTTMCMPRVSCSTTSTFKIRTATPTATGRPATAISAGRPSSLRSRTSKAGRGLSSSLPTSPPFDAVPATSPTSASFADSSRASCRRLLGGRRGQASLHMPACGRRDELARVRALWSPSRPQAHPCPTGPRPARRHTRPGPGPGPGLALAAAARQRRVCLARRDRGCREAEPELCQPDRAAGVARAGADRGDPRRDAEPERHPRSAGEGGAGRLGGAADAR